MEAVRFCWHVCEVVGDLNTESSVWFIPYRDRVHQQINQRLDKFFILNIPIFELLQPVYNQFLVQQGYLLWLYSRFNGNAI